jgi:hypothetical protein
MNQNMLLVENDVQEKKIFDQLLNMNEEDWLLL